MISRTSRFVIAGLAAFAVAGTSMPALAQDEGADARIRKLESEVRALQRKVFPGGDGRFFEPEITAAQRTGSTTGTAPSTTAVTDILVRLDALESQLAGLTAQTEENSNAIMQLTNRLVALENGGSTRGATSSGTEASEATGSSASQSNLSAMTGGQAATTASAEPAGPTAERLAAVSEIAKPQTDDPGDDEYSYGFRLWNAGFYPEAQQQLTLFVEKYPNHSRTTYGRNLLGRAYLDDGKPAEAAPWFLRNYQADKNARRAPDSLLYLAEAMIAMKDERRACIALAEFGETYPAVASGRLSDEYQANLRKVDCD
ncbi:tol-pal system YbgF family protein [Erythrobacter sp. HKB08]|uniref:tetratricopeptide repeat protein n=1 Tax=Erythrobacter sp. HKB08 TaxID=2502843 RepID=UPI001008A1C7|nr:tetratricopeptide repeat protein [Erythrobacter sp. HKB08]